MPEAFIGVEKLDAQGNVEDRVVLYRSGELPFVLSGQDLQALSLEPGDQVRVRPMHIGISIRIGTTGVPIPVTPPIPQGVAASGGTVTDITDGSGAAWRVHDFTQDGTLDVAAGGEIEYLLLGGGGGGGSSSSGARAGGGGAGEFKFGAMVVAPDSYKIHIGAGGNGSTQSSIAGGDGGATTALGLTATGGGGAGSGSVQAGRDGACGGGAAHASAPGKGLVHFDGSRGISSSGTAGGGGGGAGGAAINAGGGSSDPEGHGGHGGPGLSSAITGMLRHYCGGGGGNHRFGFGGDGGLGGGGKGNGPTNGDSTAGEANSGSGGGDRRDGGSGRVIIRYRRVS